MDERTPKTMKTRLTTATRTENPRRVGHPRPFMHAKRSNRCWPMVYSRPQDS